eukprot:XP_016883606.1 WNT1-inducible-signaling pathway protein 2 isoform X2 [Homo sapiens]
MSPNLGDVNLCVSPFTDITISRCTEGSTHTRRFGSQNKQAIMLCPTSRRWLKAGSAGDMRGTPKTHLLAFSLLCLLSKVRTQLCPTPCTCPWPPPRCPLGVPLVLDGCGCCRVCARRLGEPCDQLHVCDASQGLVCQPGAGPGGRGALCLCKQWQRTTAAVR